MIFTEKIAKAKDTIRIAINTHRNIAVSSSFGKDSMVLLHLCCQVKPDIKVFSIISDTEFEETYNYIDSVVRLNQLNYSDFCFNQSLVKPENCCNEEKVKCFKNAIAALKLDAFISGVRKDEGRTRTGFQYIETDQGLTKYNPILDFTLSDIWRYCTVFDIPLNPKYREGYVSLGCKNCSTPEQEGEGERDGRWRNSGNAGGECGIHTEVLK